jgi:hypothetical protein
MKSMKTITVWQPWATLIALREKWNETRGWPTKHRGPLAIHAAKKIDYEACEHPLIKSVLAKHGYSAKNLPTGAIVAKCNLIGCHEVMSVDFGIATLMTDDFKKVAGNEFEFGFYERGRFAWELGNVERLVEPIPAKGQQGLWNWDGNQNRI